MTEVEPTMALRITGDTLNKIMQLDRDILEMPLRDLWNAYYVQNFYPTDPKMPQRAMNVIMTAGTFYTTYRFVDGKQPRYRFARVIRL